MFPAVFCRRQLVSAVLWCGEFLLAVFRCGRLVTVVLRCRPSALAVFRCLQPVLARVVAVSVALALAPGVASYVPVRSPRGRLRRGHRLQCREQGRHRWFVAQGQVVAVDVEGDAGGREGAADRRNRAGSGAHQDGHLAPRNAVLQVCPAQDVGDVVQLGTGRRVRVDLDVASVTDGGEVAVRAYFLRRQAGERHALGEQPGRAEQRGAGAAGGAQDLDGCRAAVRAREGRRELQDAVHIGAPERVDRLVRVAEGDEGAAVAGERVQQPYLCGVGVLVLVHEDGVVLRGEPRGGVGAVGEEDRAVDEFRVVEHALHVEHVEVLGEEGGRGAPVGAADAAGERVQGAGPQAQFPAAGEDRADLVGEAAGGEAGPQLVGPAHVREAEPLQAALSREQFADRDVLLGAGEQAQRLDEQFAVLVGADQGVAERVEGGRPGARAAPMRSAMRSRSSTAALRLNVSTRMRSGSPPRAILAATDSTSVVVLPVPGPARTSSGPPVWSTTERCAASRRGGAAVAGGVRTSR